MKYIHMLKSQKVANKVKIDLDKVGRVVWTQIMPAVTTFVLVVSLFAPHVVFAAQPAVSLEQCRNGSLASPNDCLDLGSGDGWVSGNANATQSHYVEGQSVPYRLVMTNLPTDGTVIDLILGYDIKHSGKNAIDFLTSYDRIAEVVDPTDGVAGASDSPTDTHAIPAPSSSGSPVAGEPTDSFNALPAGERVFSIWNGTISDIRYASQGDLGAASAESQIQVSFTASNETAVLAWGGHIASRLDWGFDSGEPRSAGDISGSPYHQRTIDWNLNNLGNQDLPLAAGAVSAPGNLIVVKHVINDNGGEAVASDFDITVTADTTPNPANFAGDENGTAVDIPVSDGGVNYSVTEQEDSAYAVNYSTECSGFIQSAESKTCTITNDDIAPTLTVTKIVVNDDGGEAVVGDFDLFVNLTQVVSGETNEFDTGTYAISEEGPQGYEGAFSGDCDENGNITLELGGDYNCTITNDDVQAQLTVTKIVVNDDEGTAQVGDFTLFVGNTQVSSGQSNNFPAGVYVVTEGNADGYQATFGGDCDESGSVTLNPGDSKACTITNDDIPPPPPTQGSLIVRKVVVNDDGGTAEVADFTLSVNDTNVVSGESNNFDAGDYAISEIGPSGYSGTFSEDCDESGNISIVAGQSYLCVITNDDIAPTLTVTKIVVNDDETGQSQVSDFDLFVDETQVVSGETNEFAAGDYIISEDGPDGYVATFEGDCDESGNITLELGGDYNCTITNDDIAPGPFTLDVTITGDGTGTVSSDVGGILCTTEGQNIEDVCQQTYDAGTVVELTATPDEGSTFDNSWTVGAGTCTGTTSPCTITMNQNYSVTAHFTIIPPPPPPGGGGGGGGGTSGGGGGGGGPTQSGSITFNAVATKTVGNNTNESITITNTGFNSFDPGTLEVTFPAGISLVSANPTYSTSTGSVVSWDVPTLAPSATFSVDIVVVAASPGTSFITVAKYLVGSAQIAQTSVSEGAVGTVAGATTAPAPQPEVKGTTELPRTGIPVWSMLFWLLGSVFVIQNIKQGKIETE